VLHCFLVDTKTRSGDIVRTEATGSLSAFRSVYLNLEFFSLRDLD
jgi:hypothetical protein